MSGRRNRWNRRTEIRDSLAELSTPVETALEDTNSKDLERTPQESLLPIRENLITAATASTGNCDRNKDSSEDSSDDSCIGRKKLNPTTNKKGTKSNSPISASIPFTLTMTTFGTIMTHLVDVWLNASSNTSEMRQMLFAYKIFS